MKTQPKIDHNQLIDAVYTDYGIDIRQLEFMLRGFGGDCFRAEDQDNSTYFLKLFDPVENQMMAASSKAFYLPLMHQLLTRGILSDIPHLQPTLDGECTLKVDQNELVITNFISGEVVGFVELPEDVLVKLAGQIGILHNSLPDMDFEHPFIDQFEIVFETELVDSFDRMITLDDAASPGQVLLRDTILPHKVYILKTLNRLKALQEAVRRMDKRKVVCHTDLHGGNLMKDSQGRLFILDWENALIAPPEHDLFFFVGEPKFFDLGWPAYCHHYPDASIDPTILAFYFYRRALEDIADFILRILRRDGDFTRDKQEIDWMVAGLEGLDGIEAMVENVGQRVL